MESPLLITKAVELKMCWCYYKMLVVLNLYVANVMCTLLIYRDMSQLIVVLAFENVKYQVSIQSSTIPDQEHHNGNVTKPQENTTHKRAKRTAIPTRGSQGGKEQARQHIKDKHVTYKKDAQKPLEDLTCLTLPTSPLF